MEGILGVIASVLDAPHRLLLQLLGRGDILALESGATLLALLLGRTSLACGLLARLGGLDCGVSDLLGGISEEIAAEVDDVANNVAEVVGGEEERAELTNGTVGFVDLLGGGKRDVGGG